VGTKRFHLFLVVGGILVLLGPALGQTQDRPRFGGGGRGPGGQRRPFDPNMIFNFMSGGKDYIVIDEVPANPRDPSARERMAEFAQRQGITNGRLTREQFASYMQERMAQFRGGRGGSRPPGPPPGGPGAPGGAPPGAAPGAPSGTPPASAPGGAPGAPAGDDAIREEFRRLDRNNDNALSTDEMPDALRAELNRWDTNRNGTIELDEYREYARARGQASPGGEGVPIIITAPAPVEEERRPTVYRVGKLPKELPSWFEQLDKDQDGQVGLYEWKAAGRSVSEFVAMDRNGDGFVTVEEALRYQKVVAKSGSRPAGGAVASAARGLARGQADGSAGSGEGGGQGGRRRARP
jgi:Ca2+-binding EF-hand superfamily protein